MMSTLRLGLAAIAAGCVVACGGGGSSGGNKGGGVGVEGLQVATQMSVVTVTDDESEVSSLDVDLPADSDYFSDRANKWVWDPSVEALSTANEILCLIDQTAADEMVNRGPYIAQIDESVCETGSGGGESETNQSSASTSTDIEFWTVNVRRRNENSNQFVYVWVPKDGGDGGDDAEEQDGDDDEDTTIHAKMTINEGASDEAPFGRFHLDFAGVPDGGTAADAEFNGVLATSDEDDEAQGFRFFEGQGDIDAELEDGDHASRTQVNVQMTDDFAEGYARVRQQFKYKQGAFEEDVDEEFLIAFNETHFKRGYDGDEVVLSRTEFNEHVWRYNLYEAEGANAGDRVDLVSGFGIEKDDFFGWADYYGIWFPFEAELEDGDTVTRQVFGNSDEEAEEYTVTKSPGRLIKMSQYTLTLSEILGMEFTLWHFPLDEQTQPADYRVRYTNGGDWVLFERLDYETFSWIEIDEVTIDRNDHPFLNLWSDQLGGNAVHVEGDNTIQYWQEEFVNGASEDFLDGTIELYGYIDCLKSELDAETVEAGDVFLDASEDANDPYSFTFEQSDMALYWNDDQNTRQVGLADGEEPEVGPFTWGMRSGPMVTDTSEISSPHDIWNVETFYVYETGHNPWNQSCNLVDSDNEIVVFQPPVEFRYTHSEDNDRNGDDTFAGQTFLLQYNGPGNLWGIPHEADGDPSEDEFVRWYPLFGIEDGTLVGPTGTEYVIKGIEMEQQLQEDPAGGAELDLSLAEALELPDGSDYVAPDNGDEPELDEPPSVVFGEVVGEDSESIDD